MQQDVSRRPQQGQEAGNGGAQGRRPQEPEEPQPPESMDESMSTHFEFIQGVSTPQELEQLLPQLQALLYEVCSPRAGPTDPQPHLTVTSKRLLLCPPSPARDR